MSKTPIILGIDPGTQILGYAILKGGSKPSLIAMDVLKLTKEKDIYARLQLIHAKIIELIETYQPEHFAIEAPFFGKNIQSMLKLGRAQGVAIASCLNHNIPFEEYSPRRIKQSITGSGAASKEQVAIMLQKLLNFQDMPKYLDATDGLAVAVCHYYSKGVGEHNKAGGGSWTAFLNKNPNRKKA
jgi:crossover junction endodeoxyribonuclease RuvC